MPMRIIDYVVIGVGFRGMRIPVGGQETRVIFQLNFVPNKLLRNYKRPSPEVDESQLET